MRNILIALLFTSVIILVCFFLCRFFGLPTENAINISGVMAAVFIAIHQTIEKLESKSQGVKKKNIVKIKQFGYPWYLMVIYGAISVWVISSFGAFTSGVIGAAIGFSIEISLKASILYMFFFTVVALYLIGRWVGVKSLSFGVTTVLLVGLIHSFIENFANWYFSPDHVYSLFFGGIERNIYFLFITIIGGWFIRAPVLLIGYWRGKQIRQVAYFQYLINVIPDESRDTIFELAHEEVCNLITHKGGNRSNVSTKDLA